MYSIASDLTTNVLRFMFTSNLCVIFLNHLSQRLWSAAEKTCKSRGNEPLVKRPVVCWIDQAEDCSNKECPHAGYGRKPYV